MMMCKEVVVACSKICTGIFFEIVRVKKLQTLSPGPCQVSIQALPERKSRELPLSWPVRWAGYLLHVLRLKTETG